ncbi:TIGR04222 domain-containing membrane protein [Micromonospora sp. NBC_01796]|uniref:TIGR04222 domain-containing membrane protein n=1 Tax=Micromonospora sp. NBC_01796 TaxID=2975987 RepID=UPI002DD8768A|nr:TIGR04222 domain-containing membrane protein [Micromonospora sp. NBC_01796]WSA83652.1 TIGR04222 domain-containing membrane protein [Micromonospora sp. NBC_01796]
MWQVPLFTWYYLAAAAIILVGALLHRRRALSQPPGLRLTDITPAQAAYLDSGERLTVYSSLAALRRLDAVGVTTDRRLTVTGPLPPDASRLDRAVYAAAGSGLSQQWLRADPEVLAAVAEVKRSLEQANLLLGRDVRQSARRGSWLLLGLLALGVARLAIGLVRDVPADHLWVALLLVMLAYLLLVSQIPRRSRAAEAMLVQLRRGHRHLVTSANPDLGGQDTHTVAMTVALFGMSVMSTLDPEMAQEAQDEHGSASAGSTPHAPSGAIGSDGGGSPDYGSGGSGSDGGCGSGGG